MYLELFRFPFANQSGQGMDGPDHQAELPAQPFLLLGCELVFVDGETGIVIQGHNRLVGELNLYLAGLGNHRIAGREDIVTIERTGSVGMRSLNQDFPNRYQDACRPGGYPLGLGTHPWPK